MVPPPLESVYSGVVSLRSIRLIAFIGELNGLSLFQGDISNAYLESYTKELVVFIAGPEFGDEEGHTMVIIKALYGLPTSGKMWAEKISAILRTEGWEPSRADDRIWMRRVEDHYEYIGVYVDDLIVAAADPQQIFETLKETYSLRLKGVEPLRYHLGCNFFRDPDGTLCQSAEQYETRPDGCGSGGYSG